MKLTKFKKRTHQRYKARKLALKQLNRNWVQNFNHRVMYLKRCAEDVDRKFGDWQVIDVHEIPLSNLNEVDFWCCDGKSLYLLRIRNSKASKLHFIPSDLRLKEPNYVIVEMPVEQPQTQINDEFLMNILQRIKNDDKNCRFSV